MKTHFTRFAVVLAIATLLLSSAVLARSGQAQGGPPEDPGGVCAVVAACRRQTSSRTRSWRCWGAAKTCARTGTYHRASDPTNCGGAKG